MYIELFLLDNALMDWLILRLAAAFRGCKLHRGRATLLCILGALYALWVACWPPAGSLAGKIAFGCLMTWPLGPRGKRAMALSALCVFAAAFSVGGMAFMLALSTGGKMGNGVLWSALPLRTALLIGLAASFLPGCVRRILLRRQAGHVILQVEADGNSYTLDALIDSGNSLHDPLTGLPVIVAYIPALLERADLPIPMETVAGGGIIHAFQPQSIQVDGQALAALLAISPTALRGADALIPPAALTNATGE